MTKLRPCSVGTLEEEKNKDASINIAATMFCWEHVLLGTCSIGTKKKIENFSKSHFFLGHFRNRLTDSPTDSHTHTLTDRMQYI